jgi:hypothetical protein
MTRYEVYLLDHDGRVARSIGVTRTDDQEALEAAATLVGDGSTCQVWQYGRLVGEICGAECEPAKVHA